MKERLTAIRKRESDQTTSGRLKSNGINDSKQSKPKKEEKIIRLSGAFEFHIKKEFHLFRTFH